jgi:hypothetical protein
MATYSKQKLSASVSGKGIKIGATATPGTLIHTAVAGFSALDEVWVYLTNNHTTTVSWTLEWGETTAPDGNISGSLLPQSGLYLVVPGLLLQNGLEIRAFATVADVIVAHGFVNSVTL